jgi:elongation factor Ts
MAVITAAMVKALRVKTDAPMMECKKALAEADGDAAKAEEILRVKLGNKATKAAARITAEGIVTVFISEDGKTGAVLETNSETDFVAKNPEFQQMAKDAVRLVAEKAPADVAALSALELNGQTLEQVRTALVGKIGENMSFRRFVRFEAQGKLHQYVHGGSKIAALVDVVGGDEELAHDVAMHIAASKPKALDKDGVDPALIETERRVALEKAKEAGKPEALLPRIAEGTVQKFLKEVTLINQPFVKDDSVTVGALLKSKGAKVAAFALYVVGEGLEKRNEDFAAEVAAQQSAAKKA